MKRKILSLILVCALVMEVIPLGVSAAYLPFQDVKDKDWYAGAVECVYERGVMSGTSDTTFAPNANLDRAQAVQIFYNMEGQPTVYGDGGFTDVSGHWAIKAIAWGSRTGVVSGVGNGRFDPTSEVTREQFAQMLYNYAIFKEYDLTDTGNLSRFPDGGSVSSWAITALSWANGNGLMNGSDGKLLPGGTANRAQVASILMKFLQNIADDSPTEPEIGEVDPETLPTSLLSFLKWFTYYYCGLEIDADGNHGSNYDSKKATDGTSNIMAALVNVAPCVEFSKYPGVDRQEYWDGDDPVGWSHTGAYALYDGPTVDWVAKNIFNITQEDIDVLVQQGEEQRLFCRLDQNGSYVYYVPIGGIGSMMPTVLDVTKATYDGEKYHIEYDFYADYSWSDIYTYSVVVEHKEIDGGSYWSLYSHTQVENEDGPVDSVEAKIDRQDHSYYNDAGKLVIEHYYDLPVLEGDSAAIRTINASFQKECETFFAEHKETADMTFEYFADLDLPNPLSDRVRTEITYNDKGIFSVLQTSYWAMGGAGSTDGFYGETYDLNTGERMLLSDMFPQMKKEHLSDLIKGELKRKLTESGNESMGQDIDSMDIDDMEFYVKDGTVIVMYMWNGHASSLVEVELSL